jgi:hypothetical protein
VAIFKGSRGLSSLVKSGSVVSEMLKVEVPSDTISKEDQPRTLFSQVKIGSVDLEEMSKIWFMDGRTNNQ